MKLTHLHGHTSYSFLDGYGTVKQVADRIKELGHDACAVTDHGNVYGHVPFQAAMKAVGVKPIFGCEMYVVDDMSERTRYNPSLGAEGFPHATVLAMDQGGYENLLKLVGIASSEGYYYKPRVDWASIARLQKGLLVLSGCVGGYPSRLALTKGPEPAWEFVARRRQEIEHYYVELVPEPGLDISEATLPVLARIAADLGVPVVATADAHFPRAEDHDAQDLMLCIGIGKKLADKTRTLRLPGYQYYCTAEELRARALACIDPFEANPSYIAERQAWDRLITQAIDNSSALAGLCNVEIPKAAPMSFPGSAGRVPADVLWEGVVAGVARRRAQGLLPREREAEYYERATREFSLFRDKGFCDYILSVADMIAWCKAQGGLVMCRGSAGGCLLIWLLGASETDSIRHNLSFERFFDDTRTDPPDIDVDFEQSWRDKVIQYMFERYGQDNCSQIAALSLQRAKSALHDAAWAYGIPDSEVASLSVLLDSKDDDVDAQVSRMSDPSALAVLKRHPELRIIDKMVGQCRQSTIHAAGLIVSSMPLDKVVAILKPPGKPAVSSVDKHGAAELGFLKIDMLSVSAFDVTAEAARRAGLDMGRLYSLPLDDPLVYETANRGCVAGVFQLDGAAFRVAKEVGLDTFEDLYAVSALCRPGAADHVPLYKQNKYEEGMLKAYLESVHPIAAAIVRDTYGVLLYQEQVMQLCRELSGMPWKRVQQLRKRIASASFNAHELGADYKDDFVAGCKATGVGEEETLYWWEAIKKHGVYSFNKAHCVTYGIVGYWMLWLKTYYPGEYYEQFLRLEGGDGSQTNELLMKRLVREFRALGGQLSLPTPWDSRESFFSPKPGQIVAGWANLKGIGSKMAQQLMEHAPYRDWAAVKRQMPKAMYEKMAAAGLTGERPWDQQAATVLAPWLPVRMVEQRHASTRDAYGCLRPGALEAEERHDGSTVVAGYVTAAHKKNRTGSFKGDQILYVVEDDGGQVLARVANAKLGTLGVHCKEMRVGDYCAVEGWWSGDTLYISDFFVIEKGDKSDARPKRA